MDQPRQRSYLKLVFFVVGCLAVGFVGSLATSSNLHNWFDQIKKPPLNPPNWVFAPVWTILYILMAIAGWRLWDIQSARGKSLKILFVLQLVLNALWSPLFFGMQNPLAGLIDILLLWVCLAALVRMSLIEDRISGLLLTPYLLWVSFATYLNAAIWWLNR
jgi:tryptophan-rich sensory protein